jgi:IclR family acetate operon transcriptional repressor
MHIQISMRDSPTLPQPHREASSKRSPYVIASALRTLEVLQAFSVPPHQLGLAEAIERLGLERNQAYRSLKTLEAAGFIIQTSDARFELGPAAANLAVAGARVASSSIYDVVTPYLDHLASETQETVHFFIRRGQQAICIDRRESPQSVRLMSILGRTLPLHAGAVPKAMLAFLPSREANAVLERLNDLPTFTEHTLIQRADLEAELARIRTRGYAISDEDFDPSARGVGSHIEDADGRVVGGISVGGPSFRINDATLAHFGDLVQHATTEISQHLALSGPHIRRNT